MGSTGQRSSGSPREAYTNTEGQTTADQKRVAFVGGQIFRPVQSQLCNPKKKRTEQPDKEWAGSMWLRAGITHPSLVRAGEPKWTGEIL